jgi:glycosyltransferase involved in cell wall biosynthesis
MSGASPSISGLAACASPGGEVRLLCVLNGAAEHPSSRLRVLQHLEVLKARGVLAEVFVAKRRRAADLADLARRARRSDAVLVQKKLFSSWKLPLLIGPTPLVFDFDDAIFEVSPDEIERFGDERARRRAASRARRLAAVLRRSRRVIAGNRFLADHAARFARDVVVLPTAVDLRPFPRAALARARANRQERRAAPRIGWVGSRPSLRYLLPLAAPLRRLFENLPGGRFVQICNEFVDLPEVPTQKIEWTLEGEAPALLDLDIGLMPLDDSPFSRGKCGMKILMYQAAGIPVVCSPVGANAELVQEGETGFFARTGEEWIDRLRRLVADPEMAGRMGERGRLSVETRYEAGVIGSRLADLILGASSRSSRTETAAP